MLVLGIETSCDETAASIVKDGRKILASVIASSLPEHKKFGGIVPEIASRAHLESINFIVKEVFKKAKKKFDDIDLIAVTSNPGLIGSLLVGVSFARALSFSFKKPILEINHIQAHTYIVPFFRGLVGSRLDYFPILIEKSDFIFHFLVGGLFPLCLI